MGEIDGGLRDGRWEMGDGRWEMGDGRWKMTDKQNRDLGIRF
jgi:hypothetical protein